MLIKDNDCYGIVIDAGSSGSRLHIYKWQDPNYAALAEQAKNSDEANLKSVPKIYQSEDWLYKIKPGLSSFENHPDKAYKKHIKPLLKFAETIIPKEKIKDTPVFLQATAGMRLLKKKTQDKILENICNGIKKHSKFNIDDCSNQIQVIDGETEGIYGWLSLNYLSGHFDNYDVASSEHFTFGFMDMGGASAQIAFVPSDKNDIDRHREDIATVILKSINGDLQQWDVFVSTWLGFGANQARQRYWAQLVNALPENLNGYDDDDFSTRTLYDPCMPKGATADFEFKGIKFKGKGLGDFEQCRKSIYPLLLKNTPCYDEPCLFNGVHTPPIDFNKDKFVGVSEYWYIPNDIFKLGGDYDYLKFSQDVEKFCNSEWDTILTNNKEGKYNSIPDSFLIDSCFKSTWILNVLHEGFEMPRSDSFPNDDDESSAPVFQSLEKVGETELSWTLGRILLYASGSIIKGVSSDKVGIHPSELSMKNFGTSFIAGASKRLDQTHGSTILFRAIEILVVLTFIVVLLSQLLKSKHINRFYSSTTDFHDSKYLDILKGCCTKITVQISRMKEKSNILYSNWKTRNKTAENKSFHTFDDLEQGELRRSTNSSRRLFNDSFTLRSQSMHNLNGGINNTTRSDNIQDDKLKKPPLSRPASESSKNTLLRDMIPKFSLSDFKLSDNPDSSKTESQID